MSHEKPDSHPPVATGKTGVLLISLGTPERPDASSVRSFLKEFLSDRRVVELPRLLWLPILYGPVLALRPKRSARAYAKIWDTEKGQSPLKSTAIAQAENLAERLAGQDIIVDWAFTYGSPSISDQIDRLMEAGCSRILLLALYPQYSATTSAAAYDKAFAHLQQLRAQPALQTVRSYHDHPAYIDALANSVSDAMSRLDWAPDCIIASYHGIPKHCFEAGDPYPCHARKTSRLVREKLGLEEDKFLTVFQSRFGKAEWVQPYAEETILRLAAEGQQKIMVVAPSFSADCLETLEEINIELREKFLAAGGSHFHYVPCLNAGEDGMTMLEQIVRDHLT